MKQPRDTHFAFWDGARNGRTVKALCGAWIYPRESDGDPTCPKCREGLGYRDALDAAIARELETK